MWVTEEAWPPMMVCGAVAVLLVILWAQRRQAKFLLGVVGMAALAAGIWYVEQVIVTERERVSNSVYEITSAFQERDLTRTLTYISERALDLKALVTFGYNVVTVGEDMRVTDVVVEMTGQDTRAVSRFRVNATVSAGNYSQRTPSRWEARWQLEGGEWRMISIQELDPITGEQIDRLGQLKRHLPKFPG